jgi:hypothetical protein
MQPLNYQEMADFAERVLRLHPSQLDLFYLTMEETDNAILYDQFTKSEADRKALEDTKRKPRPRKK